MRAAAEGAPAGRCPAPFVFFTDLDGTLLDASYRPGPAAPALARLQSAGVPVVFCSSKTRAEQEPLRRRYGVGGPFIVENGSAVFFPRPRPDLRCPAGRGSDVLGVDAAHVRAVLEANRSRLRIELRGFADMSAEEVARATGLSLEEARRARRREYSETLVGLRPEDADRLARALRADGLRLSSGGRFHTVTGAGAEKGRALVRVMERWSRVDGAPAPASIAVGDSDNDASMLRAADRAFLVARADGRSPELPGVERLRGIGPEGFAELTDRLLRDLEAGRPPGLKR